MKVIKRNGDRVEFNQAKIQSALIAANNNIEPAYKRITKTLINQITNEIAEEYIRKNRTRSVEFIADQVERKLIHHNAYEVAKEYITYRYLHRLARNKYDDLMEVVQSKLSAEDVQNQNANMDEHSFGGRVGEMANTINKQFALDYLLSDLARNNHLNNEIYIHDLDAYSVGSHNCLSIPFDKLLREGFNTRQTDVRPAGSVNTAFQLVAVIFQLQSLQQFGGVSATHIDWTMVPYVRKSFTKHMKDGLRYCESTSDYNVERFENWLKSIDEDAVLRFDNEEFKSAHPVAWEYAMKMTERETYQAVEAMYHNLNTLQSRSGNQLPFTSINYGTCTLPEGRLVTRAILEVSLYGLGRHKRTSIFPCGIFQCMKGVNREPDSPNYDLYRLALKSTSKRLYPNYANVDWSVNAGYDRNDPEQYVSTMGCRTYNGFDINGMGFKKDGRGNIAPVTIILPTIAMEALEITEEYPSDIVDQVEWESRDHMDAIDNFMILLDQKIHEARDMLLERFEWVCSQKPEAAKFMYENGLMAGYNPEEGIRSALKHGTLVIGQLGLAEALQILVDCDHTEEKGMQLAKRIEQLFKDRCAQFKKECMLNFGVYYTPAENLCKTAMIKFKDKYGIIPKVSDKDFFTNSMHVPVWKEISAFDKIDIESELTGYSSGGCITYVELSNSTKNNIDALEVLVNYAMDKDIPYFAINIPNDFCSDCGYTDEFNNSCPECGSEHIMQLRRVTGYLTGDYKTAFNSGKVQEVEMRVKHG
jgi:ribonucleoside-triphosphate reductase